MYKQMYHLAKTLQMVEYRFFRLMRHNILTQILTQTQILRVIVVIRGREWSALVLGENH